MSIHWRDHHFAALNGVQTFSEMKEIALDILRSMPHPVSQVCGPISTGGAGSIEKNLKRFEAAIRFLEAAGLNVFDQMPFEAPMQRVKTLSVYADYPTGILEEFYLPIFESGFVKKLHFLPDWQTSFGARWEHDQAHRLGIKIEYLDGFEFSNS